MWKSQPMWFVEVVASGSCDGGGRCGQSSAERSSL